jgi:hypothetical protein
VAVSYPYKEWDWDRYEAIHAELTDEMICRLFDGTVAAAEILRH